MLKGKNKFWIAVVIIFVGTLVKATIEQANQVHMNTTTEYILAVLTLLMIARTIQVIIKMYKKEPFTLKDIYKGLCNEIKEQSAPSNTPAEKTFKHKFIAFFE